MARGNGILEWHLIVLREDHHHHHLFPRYCVSPPSSTTPTGAGYIEHEVSKLDTLAGIAIKYGVEVADITKPNGLVSDLQMFALKSLRIPLPGRHPPSPCLSNGSLNLGEGCSEQALSSASNGNNQDVLFDSFQSLSLKPSEKKVSPAMNSLQGYYGLKPKNRRASEGFDMAVYKKSLLISKTMISTYHDSQTVR